MFEDQKQFLKTLSGKTRDQNDTFLLKITNWVNNPYINPIYFLNQGRHCPKFPKLIVTANPNIVKCDF